VLEAEYATRGVSESVFQTVGAAPPGEENIANLRSIVRALAPGAGTAAPLQ
jgi:hypothetical protein